MSNRQEGWGHRLAVWAGLCVLYVVTRGLMALPWLVIRIPRNNDLTMAIRVGSSFLVWLFMVLPEHGYHCWRIMRMRGDAEEPYSYWRALRLGLYRVMRVSYAAVPAVVLTLLLYYVMTSSFGALRILKDIGSVGSIFGVQRRYGYDVGTGILLGGIVLSLALLVICWYRHTPNDYLRSIRPFRVVRFDGLTVRNFLLAAVAYTAWIVITLVYLNAQLAEFDGLMAKVIKLRPAIRAILRQREYLVYMILVLALMYCPLWCVRKYGAAEAAARMRDAS